MLRAVVRLGVFAAAVVMAGGCDSTLNPIVVAPGCPDRPLRGPGAWAALPETQLIDDFESGDGKVSPEEGRDGEWVLSIDRPQVTTANAGVSSRCAGRGQRAGHLTVSTSPEWGAMWTADFLAPTVSGDQPYDGSKYGGLSFWAGFDAANGKPSSIRVGVVTPETTWNGGACEKFCMDFHGIEVSPDTTWSRFAIRFEELRQQGWGDVQAPLRPERLIGFVVWPNHPCDLWLDDVRFEP